MFYSNSEANTISAIKVGYISRSRHVIIPTNKACIRMLQKLVEVGAIESFYTYKIGICLYAKITLLYIDGYCAISNIKFSLKKAKRYCISADTAYKASNTVWCTIILSTDKGLLTLTEAASRGIGGIVYIVISN